VDRDFEVDDRVWVLLAGSPPLLATVCGIPATDGWTLGHYTYLIRYDRFPHHVYTAPKIAMQKLTALDLLAEIKVKDGKVPE
jgi:hypothetical protein